MEGTMKRVIREIKKAGSIAIIIAMLLSFVPTEIFALNESNYKEPLVFADFEGIQMLTDQTMRRLVLLRDLQQEREN